MESVCLGTRVYYREPLVYPENPILTKTTIDALVIAQALLTEYQRTPWPVESESIPATLAKENQACRFRNYLSKHYAAKNTLEPLGNRTPVEQQYIEHFSWTLKESLTDMSRSAIYQLLETAAEEVTEKPTRVRKAHISVKHDKDGCTVTFIHPLDIPPALLKLWHYMDGRPRIRPDILGTIVAKELSNARTD